MNNFEETTENKIDLIDPVQITNQYAIFSTVKDDPLFWGRMKKEVIFCSGKIIKLEKNVFNFLNNQIVGYISTKFSSKILISSNMIHKIDERNEKFILILPYASYAMKILREIDSKLGDNVLIIGLNFFSILLLKIIKLSGANVSILNLNEDLKVHKNFNDVEDYIIKDIKFLKDFFNSIRIKHIIQISKFDRRVKEFLEKETIIIYKKLNFVGSNTQKNINFINKSKINKITIGDKGYLNSNYIKGIKYPYPYIRWDYKKNLSYFNYLVKKKIINLDFFDFNLIEINSLQKLKDKILNSPNDKLFLFKIQI